MMLIVAAIVVVLEPSASASFAAGARMGADEAQHTASLFDQTFEVAEKSADAFAVIRGDGSITEVSSGKTYRIAPPENGADVVVWHPDLYRYGAGELNERFLRSTGKRMDAEAWMGWLAMKVAVEAALRKRAIGAIRIDGHKGVPLRFDDEGILQQPLYRVDEKGRLVE